MNNYITKVIELYLGYEPEFGKDIIIKCDNGIDCYIDQWNIDGVNKPTENQMQTLWSQQGLNILKTIKKSQIDDEANRRITTTGNNADIGTFLNLSSWKKDNYIAKAQELIKKKVFTGSITEAEQTTLNQLQALWDQVKDIRNRSDTIKDDISALSNEDDINNYDIKFSIRWTE